MSTTTKDSAITRLQRAWPTIWKVPHWDSPVTAARIQGSTLVLHVCTAEKARDLQREAPRIVQEATAACGRRIAQVACEFSPHISTPEFLAETSRLECPVGRTAINRVLGSYWEMLNKLQNSTHPAAVLLRYSNRFATLALRALDEERTGGSSGGIQAAKRMAAFLRAHDLDAEMPKPKAQRKPRAKSKALRGAA